MKMYLMVLISELDSERWIGLSAQFEVLQPLDICNPKI